MNDGYVIIAGKKEGFSFGEAEMLRVNSKSEVDSMVDSLKTCGYKVIYITEIIDRIDDIAGDGAQ